MDEQRKPTEQESKEFDQMDKKFDKLRAEKIKDKFKERAKQNSRVQTKEKVFMKISDVDREDAQWFKQWCDKYIDGHQFTGLKVMRLIMERIEPLTINLTNQINRLESRLNNIENVPSDEESKIILPKTQGGNKK